MSDMPPHAPPPEPLLRVRDLARQYATPAETINVLRDVNLTIYRGDTVAIVGPSGCGKSTLMFILGLLLPPSRGSYQADGREVLTLDRSAQAEFRCRFVGFVFQTCNLIENSTVYENLELPLIYGGVPRAERPERIRDALERVDLGRRIRHRTNQLSGGEQQRVAVARAFVNRPRMILADEPTGQLDREHSNQVMSYFEQVVRDGHTTLVIVTHDPDVAARCARSYRLRDGVAYEEKP